jgi:carboxyl-terminal processing protease
MQRIAGFLRRGGVVVVVAIVAVGGLWATKQDFGLGRNMEIMVNMMRELSLQYVDEIKPEKLMAGGAAGMVRNLDPYTQYMSESEMEQFETLATGKYGGIGSTIRMKRDSSGVVIAQPYKGSPADLAGLKIGDKFITIEGEDVTKCSTSDISSKLKGTPGTKVRLSLERVTTGKVEEFEIERATNLKDWETAAEYLRELCAMIPDKHDKRHIKYNRQLLQVEDRRNKTR